MAEVSENQVKLSWSGVSGTKALDLHHYSIYCGASEDFICNNETLIRSVLKTSVTDALPPEYSGPKGLFYKVIAVDNRWNESSPATVQVD